MNLPDPKHARLLAAAVAALALTACGGGGGDASPSPTPSPTPTYTVGGTLAVVENVAVDSDTNDILQTPFVRNDTLATAQAISASAQIMGHANRAGTGPSIGRNFAAGDVSDFFQVTVAAGQTVELDFMADTTDNDLDLFVYDSNGTIVGISNGTLRNECVRISAAGIYRIEVQAFAGASIYNMRIAAPGASTNCTNATSADAGGLIAGELIVATPTASLRAAQAAAALSTGALRVLSGSAAPGMHALVALPEDAAVRRKSLAALSGASQADVGVAADAAAQRIKDTIAYAKKLRASGAFEQVLFNRVMHTTALTGTFPPNDPRYPLQRWHYEQIALPAAMNTLAAMSPQPSERPIVAVVDTGIVVDHPDLIRQTVPGYDFIRDLASAGDTNGIDNNPDDLRSGESQPSFHGTHVAGTIAAETFDGAGAAGVAPMAQIMPIRVLGVGGSGSFYDIVQGIRFAAGLPNDSGTTPARRADVINLSLGAAGVACDADTANLFAQVRAQGSILVVATGNDGNRPTATAPVGYPANCAGAIAVSSTDPRRQISYFSNTGPQVAIAAPGGDMRFSTTGTGLADGVYSTIATFSGNTRVPSYGPLQGTSMATPHVAGVMALMRWVFPGITPAQVDTLLAQGALTDEAGAAGKDNDFGWGIVNAAKAVQAAITLRDGVGGTPPPAGIVDATPTSLDFGAGTAALEFTLRTTGTTTERVTGVTSSRSGITVAPSSVDANGLGVYRVTVDRAVLALGVTTATVTATTSASRTITVGVTVEKRTTSTVANAGPIYVLVIDNATGAVLDQANVQPVGGGYTWSLTNIRGGDVLIVAGSDYNNDDLICSSGEVCGAFPVFGANLTPLKLDRNRADLNFLLAPLGAGNANAAGASAKSIGQKRRPTPTETSSGSTLNLP